MRLHRVAMGVVTITGAQPTSLPTQIPTTMDGITGKQMEETINATDSEDALKYCPSLLVRRGYIGDYKHAILSSRASGTGNSARSAVYADGILLSNFLGNGVGGLGFPPRWGLVTPEEIERVDAMYGPFSAAYPGNIVGAVVDYVTHMTTQFEAHGKVGYASQPFNRYGTGQTFNTWQTSVSVGNKSGHWSWFVNLNKTDSNGQPQGFWQNTLVGRPASYLTNAAGRPVASGMVNINGSSFTLSGADFALTNESVSHTLHGLSLKSNAQGVFDCEVAGSLYACDKDQKRQNGAANTLPAALNGGASTIADGSGTGWNNLARKGTWRSGRFAGFQAGAKTDTADAHWVDFDFQQDTSKLGYSTSDTVSNWLDSGAGNLVNDVGGKTSRQSLYTQESWQWQPDAVLKASFDPLAYLIVNRVQNVGRVATQSLELAPNGFDVFQPGMDLSGSLTYTDSIIKENAGFVVVAGDTVDRLQPNIPIWRATAMTKYRWSPAWSPSVALGIDKVGNFQYWDLHPCPQRSFNVGWKVAL